MLILSSKWLSIVDFDCTGQKKLLYLLFNLFD